MTAKSFALLLSFMVAGGIALAIMFASPKPILQTTGTSYTQFREWQAKWSRNRPTTYHVVIELSCFCHEWKVRTTVSPSEMQVKYLFERDNPGLMEDRRYNPYDVDDVFRMIEQAYASHAHRIDVVFDEKHAIPLKTFIDQRENMADDEETITLSEFEDGNVR